MTVFTVIGSVLFKYTDLYSNVISSCFYERVIESFIQPIHKKDSFIQDAQQPFLNLFSLTEQKQK